MKHYYLPGNTEIYLGQPFSYNENNYPSNWLELASNTDLSELNINIVDIADPIIPIMPEIPTTVTPYQAKIALLNANLYNTVVTAVSTANNETVRIAWDSAQTFDRNSSFIISIGQQLGLSNTQIDNLFIEASKIR